MYRNGFNAVAAAAFGLVLVTACGDADGAAGGCEDCRIELEQVATIGDDSEDGMLPGRPTQIVEDGTGRYWINVLDAIPVIHDPDANVPLRPIGRTGSGPGEFRFAAVHAELPGDSVLVSDIFEFRVMARDVSVARTVGSTQQLTSVSVLEWPHRVLAVTRDRTGAPGSSTTVVALYDMSADTVAVRDTLLTMQAPSGDPAAYASSLRQPGRPSPDSDIWISDFNRYRLVRYSPAGERVDSVVRAPDGFPGGDAMRMGGPDQPASPHMIGNWVDDDGRLWTLRAVPRTDTGDAWAELGDMQGIGEVRVAMMPADYELKRTVIEVLDPVAKRVLAEHDFDGFIFAVLPDNRVASYIETDIGVPIITIHRVALHQ